MKHTTLRLHRNGEKQGSRLQTIGNQRRHIGVFPPCLLSCISKRLAHIRYLESPIITMSPLYKQYCIKYGTVGLVVDLV